MTTAPDPLPTVQRMARMPTPAESPRPAGPIEPHHAPGPYDPAPPDAHDLPWKAAVEGAIPEFMAFYFQAAHAAMISTATSSRGPKFMRRSMAVRLI